MSADLQSLSSWITQSKIKLNITKSSVMWFTLKNFTTEAIPTVCVGGTALNSVSTQKYLGIVFDKQLSWSSHVSAVCKKTSYYLYWINAHYKHMPSAVIKPLADSLVLSRFSYTSVGFCYHQNIA